MQIQLQQNEIPDCQPSHKRSKPDAVLRGEMVRDMPQPHRMLRSMVAPANVAQTALFEYGRPNHPEFNDIFGRNPTLSCSWSVQHARIPGTACYIPRRREVEMKKDMT
jgi:hypothetical protein